MGTRADFYVGRGKTAEWLGSIAWDGYPERRTEPAWSADSEERFRAGVSEVLTQEEDGTRPDQGWPWPWDDSNTTDYAYAWDGGKVWASCFGGPWFDPTDPAQRDAEDAEGPKPEFPDMSARRVTVESGPRSGLLVVCVENGRMITK